MRTFFRLPGHVGRFLHNFPAIPVFVQRAEIHFQLLVVRRFKEEVGPEGIVCQLGKLREIIRVMIFTVPPSAQNSPPGFTLPDLDFLFFLWSSQGDETGSLLHNDWI